MFDTAGHTCDRCQVVYYTSAKTRWRSNCCNSFLLCNNYPYFYIYYFIISKPISRGKQEKDRTAAKTGTRQQEYPCTILLARTEQIRVKNNFHSHSREFHIIKNLTWWSQSTICCSLSTWSLPVAR
jgi:hypothetical protein